MATPTVWISTTSPDVVIHGDNPGDHWQNVGTVDTTQETEFWKQIRRLHGHAGSPESTQGFYLHGDADNPWVDRATTQETKQIPFWVLIAPFGDMTSLYRTEPHQKYVRSKDMAVLSDKLVRRKPEVSAGAIARPKILGIRFSRSRKQHFETVEPEPESQPKTGAAGVD